MRGYEIDKKFTDVWFKRSRELALRVGIYFLIRKSEFLPGRNGEQAGLQRSDILFFSKDCPSAVQSFRNAKPSTSKSEFPSLNVISSARDATF